MALADLILVAMGLLSLSIIAAGLLKNIALPYSVLLVILGLALSGWSEFWPALKILDEFTLTPDLVFYVFLPALIFESGLGLDARQLLKDLAPILAMAVPALLISTTLIGIGIWMFSAIDLTMALLFGALISATDPVAVIALFKELGAPLRLNVLVEGESLLNDATAIVLFGILLSMLLSGSPVTAESGLLAVLQFFEVFLGGVLVGIVMGLIVSQLLYLLRSGLSEMLTLSLVLTYASFIVAEHWLHVSGVMATLSAAITLNVLGMSRIELALKPMLLETWQFIALLANSLLFLLVGLSIDVSRLLQHSGLILLAIAVVMLARAASVYSMIPLSNRLFNLPKISLAERHIMWWGGLKGGLAIAIVLSIPQTLPGRELLINMTLGVVLFTLLVNATTIRALMRFLKLDQLDDDEAMEFQHGLLQAEQSSRDQLAQYRRLNIIDDVLRHRIDARIQHDLNQALTRLQATPGWREIYLSALRIESHTLDQLFDSALISQYTLLDLRNSLSRDREKLKQSQPGSEMPLLEMPQTFFNNFEQWVLKFLRDKNWSAGLLSKYQMFRLRQRIERDVAAIIMTQSVIDDLAHRQDFEVASRAQVLQLYQHRFERWSQRLTLLRQEFPAPVEALEQQMFTRSALKSAELNAQQGFQHGEIGAKAFNRIQALIEQLLNTLKKPLQPLDEFTFQCIASIPLFSGLPDNVLKVLSQHALPVCFMQGDVVISEGDIGDALYIVRHGVAEVSKQGQVVATLSEGEFFGEKGLLGDHVRSATVRAGTMLGLLRLSKKDVMTLAQDHHEIKARLLQVRDDRFANKQPSVDAKSL